LLSFSRKTDYAMVAMAELAVEAPVCRSAMSIAAAVDAPPALLKNVLKALAGAGLLDAERGPFGGYRLARPASELSVLEIVEAIDGPVALARCCGPGESPREHGCIHSPRCRIQHAMRLMHAGLVEVLARTTVAHLIGPERSAPIAVGLPSGSVRCNVVVEADVSDGRVRGAAREIADPNIPTQGKHA